jgi:hypothetical protein
MSIMAHVEKRVITLHNQTLNRVENKVVSAVSVALNCTLAFDTLIGLLPPFLSPLFILSFIEYSQLPRYWSSLVSALDIGQNM